MSTYQVTVERIEVYVINVTADDDEAAAEKAESLLEDQRIRNSAHNDSDSRVIGVEEVQS